MVNDCSNCERRFKSKAKEGCQVFKEKPENCWAWTDDKNWLKKVNKELRAYAAYSGTRFQG